MINLNYSLNFERLIIKTHRGKIKYEFAIKLMKIEKNLVRSDKNTGRRIIIKLRKKVVVLTDR